jgi:hypothetical protein
VDSGADVDRFDRNLLGGSWKLPLTAFSNERDAEKDELDRSFLCRKYLLQSGADPTIYATNYSSDPDDEDSALLRSIGEMSVRGSVVSIPVVSRLDYLRMLKHVRSSWL